LGKCTNARCVYGRAARTVTYLVGRWGRGDFLSKPAAVVAGIITRVGTFAAIQAHLHEARRALTKMMLPLARRTTAEVWQAKAMKRRR